MQDFRNLRVWRDAHRLAVAIYSSTHAFPPSEQFGLTSQLRRSAASISANIAEGVNRGSDKDFARFVRMALSSTNELESHLLLARDVGFVTSEESRRLKADLERVRRQMIQLSKRLKTQTGRARNSVV
ncbi:MAG: four helix bundle protein [Acidimicrobiia bacterium]|nr:four helix bundle protein [Acidimicrobiia bacterium]